MYKVVCGSSEHRFEYNEFGVSIFHPIEVYQKTKSFLPQWSNCRYQKHRKGRECRQGKNMKSRVSKGSNFSRHEEVSQIKEREWYEISWIKKTENNGDCGNEIKRNQCNEVQGESCWSGCCNDPGLGRMRPQWLLITNYASKTLVKSQDW